MSRRAAVVARARPVAPVPRWSLYGYGAVVATKRLVGLSCARHRTFFLLRLMHALNEGRITGRLEVTSAGKKDGAGAQGLARVSAMCFARAYGLRYVHSPFVTLAHAEMPLERWLSEWEGLLGLGDGAPDARDTPLPVVDLETYAMTPALWRTDRLLSVRHYHTFCALAPQYGEEVSRDLGAAYSRRNGLGLRPAGAPVEIRLHVRRGDVRADDAETSHRFTTNASVLRMLEQVRAAVLATGRTCRVRLYSQGSREQFSEFEGVPELEFRLDVPALETFRELVEADVLLLARSDFSHLAGMYCRGVKICDPRHRAPPPSWVRMDMATGKLDEDALRARLRGP